MGHSVGRAWLLLAALLFVCGCGKDDDGSGGGSGNPAAPSPAPPSGVVSLAGSWRGTSDFQQNDIRYISDLAATIRQNDRIIEGTITFTSPAWSGWTASFTGQLSGASPVSQFFGNVVVTAAPVSGGGTCTGQMTMTGETRTNTLRWEAPTMNIVPTGSSGGSTVCMGAVRTIVWILGR
jgi:hypothetical protein